MWPSREDGLSGSLMPRIGDGLRIDSQAIMHVSRWLVFACKAYVHSKHPALAHRQCTRKQM
jgi:hypothetical protein